MLQCINMCNDYPRRIGRPSELWLLVYLRDHGCDKLTSLHSFGL